jgi:hypothetical protein
MCFPRFLRAGAGIVPGLSRRSRGLFQSVDPRAVAVNGDLQGLILVRRAASQHDAAPEQYLAGERFTHQRPAKWKTRLSLAQAKADLP